MTSIFSDLVFDFGMTGASILNIPENHQIGCLKTLARSNLAWCRTDDFSLRPLWDPCRRDLRDLGGQDPNKTTLMPPTVAAADK